MEREASPCNYSLVNPNYVGFMPDIEGSQELSGATATVCKSFSIDLKKKLNDFFRHHPF